MSKSKLRFTLHPIQGEDPPLYALVVHDPFTPVQPVAPWRGLSPIVARAREKEDDGFLLGTADNVRAANKVLSRFLNTGKHDGAIDDLDERLGSLWLTVPEAEALAKSIGHPVSRPSIRRACSLGHIPSAKRQGRDWRFPQANFRHWLRTPRFHKTGPKVQT